MEREILDGLSEAASRFTLVLLPRRGQDIGSGVCVSCRGANFIVTARHLVRKQKPEDILFLRRPNVPSRFIEGVPESLPPGEHLQHHFSLPIDYVFSSGQVDDLAALRLVGMPLELERNYFAVLQERQTPDEGQPVIIVGALRRLVRFGNISDRRHGVVSLFIESGRIDKLENPPQDFDPSKHFIVQRVGVNAQGGEINPEGLSGAGVWVAPLPEPSRLWDPTQFRLAGIQTGWYSRRNVLKATRAERLTMLMDRVLADGNS